MPTWTLAPVSPCSVSVAVPDRVVPNTELCESMEMRTTPEWIAEKTGIMERRYVADDQDITGLATEAAERAVAAAGMEPHEVDVLVVGSSSPDWVMPSLGVIIADSLGITTPRIIDITQHACASAVYSMYTASLLLQEDGLETALVVCAECISRNTHPLDRTTRIFFGDAAGATVLRKTPPEEAPAPGGGAAAPPPVGLLGYDLGNSYSHAVEMASPSKLCHERAVYGEEVHSRYLQMDGRAVWQEATTQIPKSIHQALEASRVDVHDVGGFAVHQANARMVEHIARSIGVDPERMPVTADTLGNTGAASPLTSLWRLARDGRVGGGDVLVVSAIGAGFLWGSLCFRLADDIRV